MNNANNLSVFEYQYLEDFLRSEKNLRRKIYFDSCDIIKMLQGVWGFNKNYKFEWLEFKERKDVEIHAIAEKGWLGEIHLLKSHQDELLYKLTTDENNFPNDINFSKEEIDSELLINLLKEIPKEKLINPELNNFQKYFKELKTNSKLLFKSNSILFPYFWLDRYKKYFEETNIINLTFSSINHSELKEIPVFSYALSKLEKVRKGSAFSNYMDALALAQLQYEVNKFKESNFNLPLPIFYTGAHYLREVMQSIYDENPLMLSYPHPTKSIKHIPVFRYENFFIIDPIFNIENIDKNIYEAVEDIAIIKDELKLLISSEYLVSEASILEEKIRKLIGQDADLELFNKIWLNGGYKDFIDSILKYIRYYDEYDVKIEEITKIEKNRIAKQYKKELQTTSILKQIIDELKNIHKETEIIKHDYDLPGFASNEFGLIRFSFSKDINDIIDVIIKALFENTDSDDVDNSQTFNSSVTKLIDLLIIGSTHKGKLTQLITGLSILWIYSKYDLIVNLCSEFQINNSDILDSKGFTSVDINSFFSLFASSFALSDKMETELFNEILKNHKEYTGIEDYRFKLTRSFSLFQLWYHLTLKIIVPEHPSFPQKKLLQKHANKLRESIKLLYDAVQILTEQGFENDKHMRKMYYYIINNILYYNVKGADYHSLTSKRFLGFLTVLRDAEGKSVWQNRFYDTIGWYYYRRAYFHFMKSEFDLASFFKEKALKNNLLSFKGPTPYREHSNYKQLESILVQLSSDIEERIKAHNNVLKK